MIFNMNLIIIFDAHKEPQTQPRKSLQTQIVEEDLNCFHLTK